MHVTPWIHNTAHPDTSSLKRLLSHERFQGRQGEALAVALWQYTVDPVAGFYHFWSPADREHERPYLENDYVKDPLKLINSYGYMLCGTVASVYANLCEAAGLKALQIGVPGHCLNEVFYAGEWHLVDCDLRAIHRRRDPQRSIASLKDLQADPTLVSRPVEKSRPCYYLPDRSPEAMAKDLYAPGTGGQMPRHVQRLHGMDYVLRPGERLTRYPHPVGGRWHFPPHWIKNARKYEKEWSGEGPRERFPPHRTYANGCFEYRPDLTSRSRDLEGGAWTLSNAAATPDGLAVRDQSKGKGRAIFLLHSPWVITGRPDDPQNPERKSEGVLVELDVAVPEGRRGRAALLISLDGEHWEEAARTETSRAWRADLTSHLERRHRAWLALGVEGAAVVKRLCCQTWFQTAVNAYPYLSEGRSLMRYHGGDEQGGRSLAEPWCAKIESGAEAFEQAIVSSENLRRGATPFERLAPADPERPWRAVFRAAPKLLRPCPIVRAWLMVSVASIQGDRGAPREKYPRKRAKLEAAEHPDGPWTLVADEEVPVHKDGYHFSLDGAYAPASGNAPEIFLRVTSEMPAWEVRAALRCALPESEAPPLEIVHQWTQAGQPREHRETVRDAQRAFEYTVAAGPGPIEDRAVIFRVPSTRR